MTTGVWENTKGPQSVITNKDKLPGNMGGGEINPPVQCITGEAVLENITPGFAVGGKLQKSIKSNSVANNQSIRGLLVSPPISSSFNLVSGALMYISK